MKNWGSNNEFTPNTGLYGTLTSLTVNNYVGHRELINSILYSGFPPIQKALYSKTDAEIQASAFYKRLTGYIASLETSISAVNSFYKDISESYIQKFATFSKNSPLIIMLSIYATLGVFFGIAILVELIFFKKRASKCWRVCANLFWLTCAPIAVLFTLFLNVLVPVIGSMTELSVILEPTLYNKTFHSKLEFPEPTFRSLLYPCIFGDGNFHHIPNGMDNPIYEISLLYNDMFTLSNGQSGVTAVTNSVNDIQTKITKFKNFEEIVYTNTVPSKDTATLLTKLNAFTDCTTPISGITGITDFNQIVIVI
jgi:hypothetical protein